MPFVLTPELKNAILFCMENQNETFLLDTETMRCVPAAEGDADGHRIPLPEWTPVHGFRLMEEFTGRMKNPVLQAALRQVLASRSGVFRRFREALRGYPEFDRAWHTFKQEEMGRTVDGWFSKISLAQTLAGLGEEPEETEEIVQSDFLFLRRPPSRPLRIPADAGAGSDGGPEEILEQCAAEYTECFADGVRHAAGQLFARIPAAPDAGIQELFYAETPAGETAGAVLVEYFGSAAGRQAAAVTAAGVKPAFRAMGLFSRLLESAKESAGRAGIPLVYAVPFIQPWLLPVLKRAGICLPFVPDGNR